MAGILALLLISVLAIAPFSFRSRARLQVPRLWDIGTTAVSFTELAGVLAALSLASAVFIATLAPESSTFESSIGLFMLSFLILVGAAMQFGATPNSRDDTSEQFLSMQSISYLTAGVSFYLGGALSWLGLRLLLLEVHVDTTANILTWVLLLSVLAGAMRVGSNLYRHTDVTPLVCLSVVFVGVVGALIYKLGLGSATSRLWPQDNEPLFLATFAFVLAVIGYGSQTLVLGTYGHPRWTPIVSRLCQPWLVLYTLSVIQVVTLVWLSVADQ